MITSESVGSLGRRVLISGKNDPLTTHSTHVTRQFHFGQTLPRSCVLEKICTLYHRHCYVLRIHQDIQGG